MSGSEDGTELLTSPKQDDEVRWPNTADELLDLIDVKLCPLARPTAAELSTEEGRLLYSELMGQRDLVEALRAIQKAEQRG